MIPIYAKWNDVGNIAIAGDTGSGKTTTACFLASQVVLAGGKLIVCDPHGNAPIESREQTLAYNIAPLAPSFVCDVAISDQEIRDAVNLAGDMLTSRKRGSSANYPLWLMIDEFSGVMRHQDTADSLSLLLEDIATEGRKFFVGVIIMGQQWHTTRSGGGELRSVINVAIIHRTKRQVANMLLGLGRHLPDTWLLDRGEAYLYKGDIFRVQIPLVTRSDMSRVAALTTGGQSAAYGPGKQPVSSVSSDQSALDDDPVENARQRRIIELFESRKDVSVIAREVFKVTAGPPYQRALAEVNAALRREYLHET